MNNHNFCSKTRARSAYYWSASGFGGLFDISFIILMQKRNLQSSFVPSEIERIFILIFIHSKFIQYRIGSSYIVEKITLDLGRAHSKLISVQITVVEIKLSLAKIRS